MRRMILRSALVIAMLAVSGCSSDGSLSDLPTPTATARARPSVQEYWFGAYHVIAHSLKIRPYDISMGTDYPAPEGAQRLVAWLEVVNYGEQILIPPAENEFFVRYRMQDIPPLKTTYLSSSGIVDYPLLIYPRTALVAHLIFHVPRIATAADLKLGLRYHLDDVTALWSLER